MTIPAMASLAGNYLLVCSSSRAISPSVSLPAGSQSPHHSFSLKYNKKQESWPQASSISWKAGEKSRFRQDRIRATISTETGSSETVRPLTYVDRHNSWGDTFSSFVWNNQMAEEYAKKIEPLKEEVKAMLLAETESNELQKKLQLIDILERMGISYHYEKEIEQNLENIFNFISGSEEKNQHDLYDAALLFRILRQHGFDISSEIFNKFKDSSGTFKEELSNDPKGLLSLYEAAYLRRHGDDILEDALSFTKPYLENIATGSASAAQLSSALLKQVCHAVVQPLHRGYSRTEAYYNITFYEEDEFRDEKLLKFAKLDFNLLQMLHKQELSDLIRWWDPIIANFDYARDKMVECYYTALGQHFEPQYSVDRIMASKCLMLDSLIDDTFDAYGTLEELKLFNNAIQRWNIEEIDDLPDYMKILYKIVLELHEEYDEKLKKIGRSFALDYWKKETKDLVNAYYEEAKWLIGGCIPSFEEYLKVACVSITTYQMMPLLLFTLNSATKDTFEWLEENPKLLYAVAIINRLFDDTATYEDEKARGQLTTGIECYMKQYGVSKEEAFSKFHEMMEDAWKDINGEVCRLSKIIPKFLFRMALNYARAVEVFYRNDVNYYLHAEGPISHQITALLVDPMDV